MPASHPTARVALAAIAGAATSIVLVLAMAHGGGDRPAPPIEAGLTHAQFVAARASVLARAPAGQQGALADGRVTATEYRAAVQDSMFCLASALVDARPVLARRTPTFIGPDWSGDRFTYGYSFELAIDDIDPRPLDRSCQERHSRAVEQLFHLQRLADAPYLDRTSRAFHACLDRAGLPGDDADPPRRRYRAVLDAPSVDDQDAIEARKCIGASPSIGDLNP